MADAPPPALPSATILLLRDADPALEVFMVERHHQIDFATGALVFPGGKVEPGDAAPELRDRCRDAAPLDDDSLALHVAGIRETFEECGILLARPRGSDSLVDAPQLAGIKERHAQALAAHSIEMLDLAESEDLDLACDQLVRFAHWITPEFMPKRFDTHFFLVAAPPDQLALHDGHESVDSVWTSVESARAAERAGERTIIFPTLMNLGKLGRHDRVADAMRAARSEPVVPVLPRLERDENGKKRMRLPPEAGYDLAWAPIVKLP